MPNKLNTSPEDDKSQRVYYAVLTLAGIVVVISIVSWFISNSEGYYKEMTGFRSDAASDSLASVERAKAYTVKRRQASETVRDELAQLENLRSELYSTKSSTTRDTTIENCQELIGQLKTIQSDFQTTDSIMWEKAFSDYHKLKPKVYALLRKT